MANYTKDIQRLLEKTDENIEVVKEKLGEIIRQMNFWNPRKRRDTLLQLLVESRLASGIPLSPDTSGLVHVLLGYPEMSQANKMLEGSRLSLISLIFKEEEIIQGIIPGVKAQVEQRRDSQTAFELQKEELKLEACCTIAREIAKYENGEIFCEPHENPNIFHRATESSANHSLEALLDEAVAVRPEETYTLLKKQSRNMRTPLREAIERRHLPTIKLLARYENGATLDNVRAAAGFADLEILQAVLPEGHLTFKTLLSIASKDQMLQPSDLPLALAIKTKYLPVIEYLSKLQFSDGNMPHYICEATKEGNFEILKTLLAGKNKAETENLLSIDVFEAAATNGNMAIWDFLIATNPACVKGSKLLYTAVRSSQVKIVESLIKTEPDLLKVRDENGQPISLCDELTEEIHTMLQDGIIQNFSPFEIRQLWKDPNGKHHTHLHFEDSSANAHTIEQRNVRLPSTE